MQNNKKDHYDIAVIGESKSGKSTMIASLFNKGTAQYLKRITAQNEKGQTKLPVHYIVMHTSNALENDDLHLSIRTIQWDNETLANIICNEKHITYPELAIFNFPPCNTDTKVSDYFKSLEDYLSSEDYKSLISSMSPDTLMPLINTANDQFNKAMSYIEFEGPANSEVNALLNSKGLNYIKLRDTRGFLDETFEHMESCFKEADELEKLNTQIKDEPRRVTNLSLKERKSEYVQKLLYDRGLLGGLDACIFISTQNSNSLSKERCQELYGSLLCALLSSYPTILLVRSNALTKTLRKCYNNSNNLIETYNNAVKELLEDQDSTEFDAFDELLKLTLKDITKSREYSIICKHRKNYMLADISNKNKVSNLQHSEALYTQSILGVLSNTLDTIENYYTNIQAAEICLNQVNGNHSAEVTKIFNELFNNSITYIPNADIASYDTNLLFRVYTKFLVERIQKAAYFGGLVGSRGGLTTWINGFGPVGLYAIALLESAYSIRETIFNKLVKSLEPKVKELSALITSNDVTFNPEDMMQNIQVYYNRKLNDNFERLSITGNMVPRKYLYTAYDRVKRELGITETYIGKYLSDLAINPTNITRAGDQWLKDRHLLSVVKLLLMYLVNLEESPGTPALTDASHT